MTLLFFYLIFSYFYTIDIQEQEKEGEFKIGKRLKVNDAEFTELDELVVVYVEPMARWAEEMMNHPKYKLGTLDDISMYILHYLFNNRY